MCGIAGYLSFEQRASAQSLQRMLSAIAHRGPDHFGGMVERGLAMGSARLSIVDLDGGQQPSVSKDRKVAVVFNGEIFNYLDLRANLEKRGVIFETRSEVETLLNLYLAHGEEMFTKLNGQYAIVIWDGRNADKLILARDRVGIRPLFWHKNPNGFTFASEIKSLFAKGDIDARLNYKSLVQTFRFWTNVGETSAFESINQVPPGHYLVLERDCERLTRYWDWPFQETENSIQLPSTGDYMSLFSDELNKSIRRQRMADVPVGSYISGGIDSAVIAAMLHEQKNGECLKTFSVTFDDPEYDESNAQQIVADHFGFDHTAVNIRSADIASAFPQVVWQAETALFRTAPTPMFLLSKKVHENGMKVVMTGEGADEVLLGYDLFRETKIRRFWARNPESKWRGQLFRKLYAYMPQYQNPRYLNMVLDFYRPHLEDNGDPHYAMSVRWANGEALEGFFSPEMKNFSESYDPISDLNPWLAPYPAGYFST